VSPRRIKGIRERAGLTRAQFSKLIGACLMTIAKWEWGTYKPDRAAEKLLLLIEADPSVLATLGVIACKR